jgi:hypothetical protein
MEHHELTGINPFEQAAVPPMEPLVVARSTRLVASTGLGIPALLWIVQLVGLLTGTLAFLEHYAAPFAVLGGAIAVLALLCSWFNAIVLITRDRLLLRRTRAEWIVALILGGPFAGAVFIVWYARRTAPY